MAVLIMADLQITSSRYSRTSSIPVPGTARSELLGSHVMTCSLELTITGYTWPSGLRNTTDTDAPGSSASQAETSMFSSRYRFSPMRPIST